MATKKKDTAPVSVLRAEQLQTKPKETAKKNTAPVSVLRAEQLLPAPKTEASAQRAQEALGIPYSAQRAAGYMAPAKNNIFSDTQREIFENATAFQKSFGTLDNFLQNKRTTKRGFFSRPEPTLGQSTAYHNAVLWDGAMQYQQKRVQDLAAQVSVLSTAGPNVDKTGIYRDYVQAVNNYRSMIPQYNRVIDTYNGMAQAAKKLNEDWRKSIRSTDEIDKDVEALRREIAAKWSERQTHAAQLMSNPDRLLPSALETRRKNEQAEVDRYDREIANLRKDEELLQEERFWSVFYQYEDNRNDPDFLNKATPKHQAIKGTLGEEAVWRAVNSDKEIGKNDTAARMIMGALAPVSNLVGPDLAPRVMSDDEKQMFNYLWNEKSATAAVDYFKALKEDHLGRWARGEEEKYIREMAKNPLYGWKMSDLSVLMGPGKALGFLAQGIDYALDGTIDENAAYNRNTYAQRAIRDERANYYAKLAETKLGEGWGKLGSFGYQTAMSMADFIFNAAITGNFSVAQGTQAAKVAEELSLGIMSTGAAADATVEAKERGLTDGQAIVLGTVAGFAEYFTEKVSLELLLDKVGSKSGWWYFTKNVLGEGSEEVASDLINLGADIWISQDKSEWQRAIRAYENQGLDKRAAFQKAWNEQARGMLLSFAGGAISGGVMAGGSLSVGGVTPLELGQITDFTELERSAREAGASEEFTEMAKHYSALLGREIRAFSAEPTTNGFYDGKAIYINVNAKNPMEQVLGHELTHSIEEASDYTKFRQIVLDRLEKSGELDAMKEKVQRLYLSRGVELNEKKLDAEVVARYTEEHLLSDAAQIQEVVLRSRGFGQWMKGQIDALLAKLGNKDAQARTFLRRAQRYYQRALEATAGKESTGGGYSFAGEKAQTADRGLLATAQDMEGQGADSEAIRQGTGWFRGMDGKWRFEIDDSGMSVKLPEYAFNRLRDMIRHDTLFEAYPDLKDVEVYFTDEVGENEGGHYDRNLDRIVINKKYENDAETIKRILLHEIQHAIQNREGLARGATEEYWDAARERGYDTRTKAQRAQARDLWQEFDEIRQREPEFWQEMGDLLREAPTVPRGKVLNWDTLESEPDPQEWEDFDQRRDALQEKYGRSKVWQFISLWDRILNAEKYDRGASSYELYRNTAGEIEARDSDNRRDLTAEERRNTRPDIDRENVVFADARFSKTEEENELSGLELPGVGDGQAASMTEAANVARYRSEIDAAMRGEMKSNQLVLIGKPGSILTKYLGSNNPLYIPQAIVKKVAFGPEQKGGKHGLGRAVLYNLISQLDDPMAITGNTEQHMKDNYKSVVVWTDWMTEKGDSVIVPIRVDVEGNVGIYNNVNTVFDVYNPEYAANLLREGNVLYTRNGESIDKLLTQRRQVPKWEQANAFNASIAQPEPEVKGLSLPGVEDRQMSVTEQEDSQGRRLSEGQKEFFANSKARDEQGRLLTLYHQTENDFTVFDPRHEGAGTRDNQTPYGIFLKSNTRDIGVRGKKQMALYANITNPLVVENRTALEGRLRGMSPEYADLSDQHRRLDSEYQKRFDEAQKKFIDFLTAWRVEHPDAGRTDVYEAEGFESAFGAADEVLVEWEAAARELETKTKNVITQVLEEQGYDGLFLQKDQGAWGRSTDAVVALRPEQVKNIDNKNPTKDKDIRYSLTEEPKGLELPSVDDAEITPAGAQETDGRLSLPKVETEEIKETKQPKTRKKPPKPVAESKPILARNWLNRQIMDSFGIRENKTEAGKIIQQYADKALREGAVTDEDVSSLFAQLYDRGVFEVFPDDYSQTLRELVTGGQIQVTNSLRADFGDDWADFRRRAFAAGLLLTNKRESENAKVRGVDSIYRDLSDMSPGLFPADEYDERTQLEKIVQAAENGKAEQMTLGDYLVYMDKNEGQDMFEAAERMQDKIAQDMRTFGEMAGLEIRLRDRTGVKIAQERERLGLQLDRQDRRISEVRKQERERFREIQQRARERKQISELQQKTLKQLQWLSKNRFRAPEELRGTWDELLGDMDIYAVHAADEMHYSKRHDATYRDLIKMYKEAQANDPNFLPSKELERVMSRVDGEHLEDLDIDSLKNLYQAITGLRTEFYNRNNAIMENETAALSDIFDETRQKMTAQRGYTDRAVSRILNEESLTPMNVLRRMVGWDKDSEWVQMAKQLEKGEKIQRDYKVRAERLLEDFLNENKDWFTRADGIGKDAIWYEVQVPEFMEFGEGNKPIFGDTVSVWMTPLQKVHMYLESKSYDNLRHMLGGRTFADKDLYSKGERARAFAAGKTIKLAPETVRYLVKDMSPEEMKLAKILENYYNVWSKGRINEVSNKLYGYDKAMNANYAPILTNQNYVGKELGVGDATAAGVGNLKARIYSKNPSYNVSAIEAFERSVDQTSKFVGMAIAESNWQKLLNWQVKGDSMRDVITHTWDKRGLDYIEDLIETLQGNRTRDGKLVLGESTNKLLSNYISAVFGSNPGIVFKQAASYPQFAAVLGWSTVPRPNQFFNIDTDLINTYTSELAYRQMGYATPETAQLKNNPGLLQRNKALNFVFGGGSITAMDAATVKRGWAWAENAVKRDFPDLNKGTEAQIKAGQSEYYKKVAEYFEDAVSTTQPMYDEMHRPYIMKEAKGVARAFTMFKTVPMQQYNTLRRMWGEYDYARQQYRADPSDANRAMLKRAAHGAANSVTATIGSILGVEFVELLNQLWKNRAKKYRDDDDELTAASIGEEVAIRSLEDFFGMVPAGKEIAQILENLLMGKKWYGIEIPGGEQINDVIETIQDTWGQIAGFITGSADVLSNGEDWGLFMKRHAREYAGAAKNLIQKTAMYFRGLPLENLEKYIMGAVQFSPELTAAMEDVFKTPGKSDLKGLRGHMLRRKIEDMMKIRGVELSKTASDYLSYKYQNGVNVIPTDTPKEITVDGESVKLSESQKLKYERAWAKAGQDINTLIASRDFKQADEATQQRMIGRLYAYATEEAKKAALGSYEQDAVAARAQAVIRAGGTAAQWAMLDATTNFKGANDVDAYDAIARSSAPESVKRAMFGAIKGTALTTESGEPTAYAQMQTVTAAGMTVSAYARWLAESGDKKTAEKIDLLKQFGYSDQIKRAIIETMNTDKQQEKMQQIVKSGLSVDGYLDIRANGAEDEYIKLLKNGIKGEKAAQTAILAQQIKDEAGPGASDLEKLRVAIDRSRSTKEQMDALTAILTTDQCRPYVVGNKMGVTPDIMVTAKEKMRDYDADQNGSYKNDEVTAMIEGIYGSGGKLTLPGSGTLSNDQKAVLWQLLTGSTSAKNNPYSVEIGNQVLAAKAAQKETDGKLKLPG